MVGLDHFVERFSMAQSTSASNALKVLLRKEFGPLTWSFDSMTWFSAMLSGVGAREDVLVKQDMFGEGKTIWKARLKDMSVNDF